MSGVRGRMIDAVLSYHLNPDTCGVTKFNRLLAAKLGVPHGGVCQSGHNHPLFSLKFHELRSCLWAQPAGQFSLFIHDEPKHSADFSLLMAAQVVYAGNAVIAGAVRPYRPDVVTAFCPSTLQGNPHRAVLNVLTFGMAHKLQIARYQKLKTLLDDTGQDYTLSVSTAVHEGSPWDAVATVGEQLREIFGDKTRVHVFLADDALARELQECSAVALFFDPALRANNTTFWAAVDARKTVITTLDGHSPVPLDPTSLYDIDCMTEWPMDPHWLILNPTARVAYSWDALLQTMGVTVPV